jgi:hypothetical protein
MRGTCTGETRNAKKKNWSENLKERDHLGDENIEKFTVVFLSLSRRISI